MIASIVENLLLTAFFVVLWSHFSVELLALKNRWRALLTGLTMGLAAIASMFFAVHLPSGIMLDFRVVPLAISGAVGGPMAALIATVLASGYRIGLGGPTEWYGVAMIVLTGLCGVIVSPPIVRFSWPVRIAMLTGLVTVLPAIPLWMSGQLDNAIPSLLLSIVATPATALILLRGQIQASERSLLRAAVRAAPEYVYIKDLKGRLTTFSNAVQTVHGATSESDLIGKSDLDLDPGLRGRLLYEQEQQVILLNEPVHDQLDEIILADGQHRTYSSSKSAVLDADGKPIGLVGITRDVTTLLDSQQRATDTIDQLSLVLGRMADGIALYDEQTRLIFCNEQYHDMFPLTRDIRVPGALLEDVLRAAIARGEQVDLPADQETWISNVVIGLIGGGSEEVRLEDGRVLAIRNRTVERLGFVSVVSDITELRTAEQQLAAMTDQLRHLASIDALTGLTNRRSLNELLADLGRSANRMAQWVSVLMIDVDLFKSYNDTYGHPAGDRCLQLVANAMSHAVRQNRDIAARYGGEEFCIVLPDADEDAAYVIAERIRTQVKAAAIPHAHGIGGIVTISIGIATMAPSDADRSLDPLIEHADKALYYSKSAGRNRIFGWRDSLNERLRYA